MQVSSFLRSEDVVILLFCYYARGRGRYIT